MAYDAIYLLGAVKEWEQASLFADICNRLPLFFGRVDSSRIVSACMKQDNISSSSVSLQFLDHLLEVECLLVMIPVWIMFDLNTNQAPDVVMIDPARA